MQKNTYLYPEVESPLLTLEMLDKIKPNAIFAYGLGLIIHPWFNDATLVSEGGSLESDGRNTMVSWVAIRGTINDWAIYHSMDANICKTDYFNSQEHLDTPKTIIARYGAKLRDLRKIQEFVPCTQEVLERYRY